MLLVVIAAGLLWLALLLLWFYLALVPLPRAGRARRRGGYMELLPRASASASPTTVEIRTRTATSTECKPVGLWPVGADSPVTPAALNRITELGDFSSSQARGRGVRMTAVDGWWADE